MRGMGAAITTSAVAEVLTGTEFDLTIDELPVNFTGKRRTATAVNGRVPGPLLRWKEGDTVTIRVTNRLKSPTSIHWHGMILPAGMDGVPGLSFDGIAPGATFTYRFTVNQSGTYWYHSHSRFQEQVGLYGPIIIEPRGGEHHPADIDHVMLFSDWTDADPEHIYRTLKLQSDAYNYGKRTAMDFARDARAMGYANARADRKMWGAMRMTPTDLLDVSGAVYTYLLNGATPAGNWTGTFEPGQKIKLRIINGSSMSLFDLRIPGLSLTVVAADGQNVEAVTVDELRIAPAEVYDVVVEPQDSRAYTVFAQALDRSGFARGTLAPRAGLQADVPSMDARSLLSMQDMGMGHPMDGVGVESAPPDFGPAVDAVALQTSSRLDDPGVGLRDNGRRVLTYADLRTVGGSLDPRPPGRTIELHLTGHMARYIWSFNGQKFSESEPLRLTLGERVRIVLINDSMMIHPIHLHGMWSELLNPEGEFLVRKHTVMVQPAQRITLAVNADAPGAWAFHCHLLYHMEAGMFREVRVEAAAGAASSQGDAA